MNPKEFNKSYIQPSASFIAIEKLCDAGYLINRVSQGVTQCEILLHNNKEEHLTVQNGTQLFVGSRDEVKAFLFGMVYMLEDGKE